MKLPPRFVLVIEGKLSSVNSRALIVPDALPYLLDYLLRGNAMDPEVFRPFGRRFGARRSGCERSDNQDEKRHGVWRRRA